MLPPARRRPIKYSMRYFTVKSIEDIVAAKGSLSLKDIIGLDFKELRHAGASKQALSDEIRSERHGLGRTSENPPRVRLIKTRGLDPARNVSRIFD